MNSVFAAATLACVSQAVKLTAEPIAMAAPLMSAPTSTVAAPADVVDAPVTSADPPMAASDEHPSSDDEHAGAGHAETFEESLESEEMHNEWRTHQVEHQNENAHLASEREARTTEYFAALAASHGADAAVVHATAMEEAANNALHTATDNAAAADAKWTEADRELHQTTEELADARAAMEAARVHHTKVIGDAHGA